MALEKLNFNIPSLAKWNAADLEAKATEQGMNKSEFMLMAIDYFMQLSVDERQEHVARINYRKACAELKKYSKISGGEQNGDG